MYKVSFIILHYMSFNFTNECIESILKNIKYSNYDIIIVDNNSTNDSFEKLKEKYSSMENVFLIKNNENLGFAKGNNIGYRFAKYKLNSDFIILLNNDTIIEQENFIELIIEKYEKYNFYVLGPDILTLDYRHQNPHKTKLITYKDIVKELIINFFMLFLTYIYIDIVLVFIKNKMICKNYFNNAKGKNVIFYKEDIPNVELHGSCLIFSPNYIKEYDGLYSKTFMYGEEEILFYTMCKESKLVLYSPSIRIIHKEKGSTSYTMNKSNYKRRFIFKNLIMSRFILLRYLIFYNKEKKNFEC